MVELQITKVTTAPKVKCPKCKQRYVVWKEVEGIGIGFYHCLVCGHEGW